MVRLSEGDSASTPQSSAKEAIRKETGERGRDARTVDASQTGHKQAREFYYIPLWLVNAGSDCPASCSDENKDSQRSLSTPLSLSHQSFTTQEVTNVSGFESQTSSSWNTSKQEHGVTHMHRNRLFLTLSTWNLPVRSSSSKITF